MRFINDDNWPGFADEFDWLSVADRFAGFVEVVYILLVDSTDGDHHNLDLVAGCKRANLTRLTGVVSEIFCGHSVKGEEVKCSHFQRFEYAFTNCHRRHNDDELGEAVLLV